MEIKLENLSLALKYGFITWNEYLDLVRGL